MLWKSVAVWCLLVVVAILNGGAREKWITPRAGEHAANAISCLTGSTAIFIVTLALIGWIGPTSARDAVTVGALWLLMTVAFEFGFGRYVMGKPWSALLADYNILKGRLWPLVLITTTLAPVAAARLRALFD